ncbi:hypothetical protein EW146_g5655 [Bondarzewia mesenterica]|uniref:Uncharacterized protein n=1 Tax=Bondarzewia mesenterica TaxID=1095465 RepID=A0A4S4LQV9_9AGAM|nr:hypothetical protein EW146_g5655 [Bondarzewia mesenterica]
MESEAEGMREKCVLMAENDWDIIEDSVAVKQQKVNGPFLTLSFELPQYREHGLPPPPFLSQIREVDWKMHDGEPPDPSLEGSSDLDRNSQPIRNPFLNTNPSGDTPSSAVTTNPFEESIITTSLSVGNVTVHTPRITCPIAAYIGMPVQAQVISQTISASRPSTDSVGVRTAEPKMSSDIVRARQMNAEGGSPFFASRIRKLSKVRYWLLTFSSRVLTITKQTELIELKREDAMHSSKTTFDYLNVEIPHIDLPFSGDTTASLLDTPRIG